MIKITNLSKKYINGQEKILALQNINLQIKKGEIAGVIGFSGAGKSTLVRCINLLEQPSAGQILINEQEITGLQGASLRAARQKIGMIFQHFNLLYSRTVKENIAFPLEIAGLKKDIINERVSSLLQLVGLSERADAYPAQLSGGQKQRVGIARALANEPKVLLCDEATSALDPATTKNILTLLKDINRTLGLTIVVITHEMQVIKEICDTVSVMENGQIIENGSVFDVFSNPLCNTTKQFVSSLHNFELPSGLPCPNQSGQPFHQTIRIAFAGKVALEPIVSLLPQKFGVIVNILAGNIDYLQGKPLGTMILDISGEQHQVEQALKHLSSLEITVEVKDFECRKPSTHS